jgi:hypothetical protein
MPITRALLLWLLMLALPLQGLASVRWADCHSGPGRHAAIAHADHDSAAHHDGHEGHSGHQGHAMPHAQAAIDDDAEVATACSVCAACCVVAAPAPAPAVMASEPEPGHLAPPAIGSPLSALPHRLERPPRAP